MLSVKTGPWTFQGTNANSFYHDMLQTIMLEGEVATPRGLKTLELLHCITRVEQPRQRVLTVPYRNLNPFFNMAESLWILEGESAAWWILYFNSQLRKYLDSPLTHFYGAYGERLRKWPRVKAASFGLGQDLVLLDQMVDCFWTLRNDPQSRQAAMILRHPQMDKSSSYTLDRPCNLAVTFKLRYNKLWMSVFNRSNDVVLGLTSTNIVQFSSLQETLASWLGVDVGPYTHYSDSLHLYDTQDVSKQTQQFDIYNYVEPTPMQHLTPGDSDAMRHGLYLQLGTFIKQDNLIPEFTLDPLAPALSCPYWDSVRNALCAYIAHKSLKNWQLALAFITRMKAHDWQIECLRFLADRHSDKPEFSDEVSKVFQRIPLIGSLTAAQEVWKYIFQSQVSTEHE